MRERPRESEEVAVSGKKLAEEGGRRTDDRMEGDHVFVARGGEAPEIIIVETDKASPGSS